ncbi:MAG: ROK family protein [Bacteroidetes bacterium]|nr:ROK family protein [Bacteroidota bacterium]
MNIAVAVDIGGTNTKLALISQKGEILKRTSIKTVDYSNEDQYLKALFEALENLKTGFSFQNNLVGIGVGAPGCNPMKGHIDNAANLPFHKSVNIVQLLTDHYKLPVFLENDSNTAALGELYHGGARNMKDIILLTLGTGLGCGIIVDGKVLRGTTGLAGELGHVGVQRNGRQCACGKRGCLETYVSATGIKRTIFELMATTTFQSELRNISYQQMSARAIGEAAQDGDEMAIQAFEFTAEVLGEKLADLITCLEPEAIFLAGGLTSAGKLIFEPTKVHTNNNLLKIYQNKVAIIPSELGANDAALLGAASLVWKNQKVNSI